MLNPGRSVRQFWFPQQIKINSIFILLVVPSIVVSTLLRWKIPVDGGNYSPNDDYLAVRLAKQILTGNWLGPWDNTTLAKGPGQPILLSALNLIPIPQIIALHFVYLIGALILSWSISKNFVTSKKFVSIIAGLAFTLFAFNPIIYQQSYSRIYRNTSTYVFLFLLIALYLRLITNMQSQLQNKSKKRTQKVIPILLGLTLSLLVLLRDDSYWILIAMSGAGIILVCLNYKHIFNSKIKRIDVVVLPVLLIVFSYLIPIQIISSVNQAKYGVKTIENFYSGEYARAMKLWVGVDVRQSEKQYLTINRHQRLAVYKISPTALRLEPHLETKPGTGWKSASCAFVNLCDESGPMFQWEVRDAAVQTGLISDELTFQSFFKQIANDIQAACMNGNLPCVKPGLGSGLRNFSYLPKDQIGSIMRRDFFDILKYQDQGNIRKPDTYGSSLDLINDWHSVVNYKPYASYKSSSLNTVSGILIKLSEIYSFILKLGIILWLFQFIRSFYRFKQEVLSLVFNSFLLSGIVLTLAGKSLFEISMGVSAQGLYLLNTNLLMTIASILGVSQTLHQLIPTIERVLKIKSK